MWQKFEITINMMRHGIGAIVMPPFLASGGPGWYVEVVSACGGGHF